MGYQRWNGREDGVPWSVFHDGDPRDEPGVTTGLTRVPALKNPDPDVPERAP